MTVDCMTCLVALAHGLLEKGTHADEAGVTHAVVRANNLAFLACAVSPCPDEPGYAMVNLNRAKQVP